MVDQKQTSIRYYSPLEKHNFKRLLSMRSDFSNVMITFRNHDKSVRVLNTNPSFFKTEDNKRLPINKIIENINALKHDLNAKDYIL
jgi:hypothetical protein